MTSSTAAFPIIVDGLCSPCKEKERFGSCATGKEGEVVFCRRHKIYLDVQHLVEEISNHLVQVFWTDDSNLITLDKGDDVKLSADTPAFASGLDYGQQLCFRDLANQNMVLRSFQCKKNDMSNHQCGTISVVQYIPFSELRCRMHEFQTALAQIIRDWKNEFGETHLGEKELIRLLGEVHLFEETDEEIAQLHQQKLSGLKKFYEYAGQTLDKLRDLFRSDVGGSAHCHMYELTSAEGSGWARVMPKVVRDKCTSEMLAGKEVLIPVNHVLFWIEWAQAQCHSLASSVSVESSVCDNHLFGED